jgi:hypothetical protein
MQLKTDLTTASPTITTAWVGGRGILKASGTWGGGTLTLTWCETEAGTFVPIGSGVSLSGNGSTGFGPMPAGFVTATLSGSTGATVSWGVGNSDRSW